MFSMLLVAKFVLLDTLIYRFMDGSATAQVVFNLQTMTALVVTGSLVLVRKLVQSSQPLATERSSTGAKLHLLALFVVAWTGTFEIERFIILHPAIVSPWPIYQFKQMAWSMWWTMSRRRLCPWPADRPRGECGHRLGTDSAGRDHDARGEVHFRRCAVLADD